MVASGIAIQWKVQWSKQVRNKNKPKRQDKPTHKYMNEFFFMRGSSLWVWSFELCQWRTLWKSLNHNEIVLLFKKDKSFKVKR